LPAAGPAPNQDAKPKRTVLEMDIYFLVGAILGSGLFIALGREPAERLVRVVQDHWRRSRR
jgi:hypothetical protein